VEASDAASAPSAVALSNASIYAGTLTTANGGIIDTVAGTNSTLNAVTISARTTVTVTTAARSRSRGRSRMPALSPPPRPAI
jgi:hypothetical protein